uniref:Uma2 family endonuclease n=1 Tax=uncultured Thiotrichaceae bacterium TaxID=298394 RepID=A0A6S6UBI5_9GAMM|nr:MAG: Uma2 family endonuclease [uncultured Thiotrichaceae bacterium]
MHQTAIHSIAIDEYLRGELESEVRHEYIDGQVYAMAGAGEKHNLIAGNLFSELRQKSRGTECRPFISDMKLYLAAANKFYYPDIMLACDPEDNHEYYKERPCLLIEVLSASAETTDRREKLHAYQGLPSLKEYVLISQDKPQIEMYQRTNNNWNYFLLDNMEDVLHLSCLNLDITLPLIFEDVFN